MEPFVWVIVGIVVATIASIWSSYYVGKIDQKNKDLQADLEFAYTQLNDLRLSYNALARQIATALEKHVVVSNSTETETN